MKSSSLLTLLPLTAFAAIACSSGSGAEVVEATGAAVTGSAAGFLSSEVAPAVIKNYGVAQLAALIEERTGTPYFQQGTVTAKNTGYSMDALKVVQAPAGSPHRYLGVHHHHVSGQEFETLVAYSDDLKTWNDAGVLSTWASMPDIGIMPDGEVLILDEYDPNPAIHNIRVAAYPNVAALLSNAGGPSFSTVLPSALGFQINGTPSIGYVEFNESLQKSTIHIGFHFLLNQGDGNEEQDLQATGTLNLALYNTITYVPPGCTMDSVPAVCNPPTAPEQVSPECGGPVCHPERGAGWWTTAWDNGAINAVEFYGGHGKIGKRQVFAVGGQQYEVLEAQTNAAEAGNYSDWKLFLLDRGPVGPSFSEQFGQQIPMSLSVGSGKPAESYGVPTISFVTLPDGAPAAVVTTFLFTPYDNSVPGGEHLYVVPL